MRSDAAARQHTDMEKAMLKAILNLPPMPADTHAHVVTNISCALVEAYNLGAIEVLEVAPWETTEIAYPERPEPKHLNIMARQGWEPWDIANVMMPKVAGGPDKNMLGFLVRYKRRAKPQAEPSNDHG